MTTAAISRLGRNAALDQMFGRRSLRPPRLAVAAGVFGPARDDDPERAGIMSSRSETSSPSPTRNPVAAGAALVGEIDDDLLARKMFGQRAAIDLALAPDRRVAGGSRLPSASVSAAAIACSTSSSMRANWSRIDLLRSRAEAMTLKHLDDGDQTLALVARGDEQFLERPCIVGKRIGGVVMTSTESDSPARRSFHLENIASNHETAVGVGIRTPRTRAQSKPSSEGFQECPLW